MMILNIVVLLVGDFLVILIDISLNTLNFKETLLKKLIVILGFFLLTSAIYAKQFCVRISCFEEIRGKLGVVNEVRVDISEKINEYLKKGYKLISITPEVVVSGYGSTTQAYYCIFDDGVN